MAKSYLDFKNEITNKQYGTTPEKFLEYSCDVTDFHLENFFSETYKNCSDEAILSIRSLGYLKKLREELCNDLIEGKYVFNSLENNIF